MKLFPTAFQELVVVKLCRTIHTILQLYCTKHCYLGWEMGSRSSSKGITWKPVKKAESRAPPQTYRTRICILLSSPNAIKV